MTQKPHSEKARRDDLGIFKYRDFSVESQKADGLFLFKYQGVVEAEKPSRKICVTGVFSSDIGTFLALLKKLPLRILLNN